MIEIKRKEPIKLGLGTLVEGNQATIVGIIVEIETITLNAEMITPVEEFPHRHEIVKDVSKYHKFIKSVTIANLKNNGEIRNIPLKHFIAGFRPFIGKVIIENQIIEELEL